MDVIYKSFCDYVRSITDVSDFKSHPSFAYMLEHVTFEQGREYLRYVKHLAPFTDAQIIDYCNDNDKYGNGTKYNYDMVYTSPTNLRYIFHAYLILKHAASLGKQTLNMVEVGCGYGGLCLALHHFSRSMNITIENYYLVDLPDISRLQELYVGKFDVYFKTHFHSAFQYGGDIVHDNLFLVSNYCFSEISDTNQKQYIAHLFPKVSHGFMTWNSIPVYDFGFSYRQESEYPNTFHIETINKYVYF